MSACPVGVAGARHIGSTPHRDVMRRETPTTTRRSDSGVLSTVAVELVRPHTLVPSSTPGHAHLYLDIPMTWRTYRGLLWGLSTVDVIEHGFYQEALQREETVLPLPWVKKDQAPPASDPAPQRPRFPGLIPLARQALLGSREPESPATTAAGLLVIGEPGAPGLVDRVAPGTLDRTLYARLSPRTSVGYPRSVTLARTTDLHRAELISSRLRHGRMHAPAIDLSVRHDYDPATGILALHLPMSRFMAWLLGRVVDVYGIGRVLPTPTP